MKYYYNSSFKHVLISKFDFSFESFSLNVLSQNNIEKGGKGEINNGALGLFK